MTDMTYDPEADAVYIYLGRGKIDRQETIGDLVADVDADGRILGIEILSASVMLAPGDWQKARRPGDKSIDAAE
ncbi:MAG: DUF2283 domain-containing protein [Xanthobacteraceae bacterium]